MSESGAVEIGDVLAVLGEAVRLAERTEGAFDDCLDSKRGISIILIRPVVFANLSDDHWHRIRRRHHQQLPLACTS